MRKQNWSDEQLEDLLRQMPKVEDHRDKQEIYQSVTLKMSKRKSKRWIIPSAATAAALLLIFILAPTMLNWQEAADSSVGNNMERMSQSSSDKVVMQEEGKEDEETAPADHDDNDAGNEDKSSAPEESTIDKEQAADDNNPTNYNVASTNYERTAIYDDEVADQEVLTYQIPDKQVQNIVPVSILVQKEQGKSKFDLFKEYMHELRESEWGLMDYYPLDANLELNPANQVLTVNVPEHNNLSSSTSSNSFGAALSDMLYAYDIKQINMQTDGQPGIDLGNGKEETFIPGESSSKSAYYFYYPDGLNAKPFLVPFRDKLSSVKEAFVAMKKNIDTHKLEASIPDDIDFEAEESSGDQLVIRFTNDSDVVNDESTLYTIEAILLTAKEFDYTAVRVENADVDQIGTFNLNEEIKVPLAANKRSIN
ncbi:hypothetical protein [Cytobacillus purgationiresistens]|uniref:Negative regulator of sigma-X activity n=1 Tax=Cytobacillus purgationiresistens TaxID=863449 RepID=A0ABU0AIN2_9BACI|nr:hypothetical protein [Cytobacillus purgationiresistens]MDQ0271123.1 hypothetical protein [Cytobacillus purgationiresistens]